MIDLHTHTTASDGRCSPGELVARAAAAGVTVLSVTDHDTVDACAAAAVACAGVGIAFVPGIEITAVREDIDLHVLGYFIEPGAAGLRLFLAEQRQRRIDRIGRMVSRLEDLGMPLDAEAILRPVVDQPGKSIGRPAVARALVAAGYVKTTNDAFATLLHNGSPYYVPKADTPVERAIEMVRAAGGVAVFAHPLARRRGRVVEPSVIVDLAAVGLGGVEVDHPDHAPDDRELLRELAAAHGLVATGSSDYHGTNKTTPVAAEHTAPHALDALVDRTSGVDVLVG